MKKNGYIFSFCFNLSGSNLEIGKDKDHVHFLVQSVPTYSVTKIIRTIKSVTAREIFAKL